MLAVVTVNKGKNYSINRKEKKWNKRATAQATQEMAVKERHCFKIFSKECVSLKTTGAEQNEKLGNKLGLELFFCHSVCQLEVSFDRKLH